MSMIWHTSIANIVVGSGPSAFAAAKALKRQGQHFLFLDVGHDLDDQIQRDITTLRSTSREQWPTQLVQTLFPPPLASAKGVEKRFAFGSTFTYERPATERITCDECVVDVSYAKGGFGNVWGAATLPFAESDLKDWPVPYQELRQAYTRVLRYMPLTGKADKLEEVFPLLTSNLSFIPSSPLIDQLQRTLAKKCHDGRQVLFGRARLAVNTRTPDNACTLCGYCLDGCAFGAIFNPRTFWHTLDLQPQQYVCGHLVRSFRETEEGVEVDSLSVKDGSIHRWRCLRLFIGAGAVNSTVITLRSLKLYERPVLLADAQYFFFPVLSTRACKRNGGDRFTLAELFLEMKGAWCQDRWTHFQIYSFNRIFRSALVKQLKGVMKIPCVEAFFAGRFLLFQGFLNSALSAQLSVTLAADDTVMIRGIPTYSALRATRRSAWEVQKLIGCTGVVLFPMLNLVAPGRSFHLGASFPMTRSPSTPFSSDSLGRPIGLQRVHLIDAASFTNIPATTFAFSLMAHADRIVEKVYG